MKSLSDAKMLGGIGTILLFAGAIPYIGFILAIAGFIMQLIAVKKISEAANDKEIFSQYMINFIFGIMAFAAVIFIMIATFGSVGGLSFFTALEGMDTSNPQEMFSYLSPLLSGCILALIVAWIFSLLGAIYLNKSYQSIAEQTKVDTFKTTGLLYIIGTASFIVIIGIFIILIARIFEIVSFFSLPETLPKEKMKIPDTEE